MSDKHQENRHRVCLLCFKKTKTMKKISSSIWEIICKHFIDGLEITDERIPDVLCTNCYKVCCEYRQENFTRSIELFNHASIQSMTIPKTRSYTINACPCVICEVAGSIPSNIAKSNQFSSAIPERKPVGRPCNPELKTFNQRPVSIKICSKCYSEIGRGKAHVCLGANRVENLSKLTSSADEQCSNEQFAASVLQSMCQSQQSNAIELKNLHGKPTRITLSPNVNEISSAKMETSSLRNIQTSMNLSNSQTKDLSNYLRCATGSRKFIESNSRIKLHNLNHLVDDLFSLEVSDFHVSNAMDGKEEKAVLEKRPFIYCNNLKKLVSTVISERKRDIDSMKIGIDGGGNFLKVCLTLETLEDTTNNDSQHTISRYRNENINTDFKDGGVKKLIIIGLVPNIPENYRNILTIWTKLNVESVQLPVFVVSDLKLTNIMCGLMSHGSAHPCAYCDITKDNLGKGLSTGNLRTLLSLKNQHWNWRDSGEQKSNAKKHGNVIHSPIFRFDNNIRIVDLIPPPELHLLTGAVSTMFNHLCKVWPEAEKWAEKCNVQREAYFGGAFTGNSAQSLLKHTDCLMQMGCPIQYINAFVDFNQVVQSCFSKELHPDYQSKIKKFIESYKHINVPITPKIHIIQHHISDFCSKMGNGLGRHSEQASEAVHYDFLNSAWNRYKTNEGHPLYGDRLLRSVADYANKHL